MSLYSVMLVDDEEEVREAIVKKLNWEEMGFQVVATAENGEEALELAEHFRLDVVMTDIKMPFMDGLTFCRKLKEHQMSAKLVIFSGFDEFEYAQEAIKLEVEEYVLKPINAKELESVFERLKVTLDQEIAEKQNIEYLNRYYEESLPIIKEQFLAGLIQGRIPSERIMELNTAYEMGLQSPYFCAGEIHMDSSNEPHGHDIEAWRRMMVASGQRLFTEHMSNLFSYQSFLYLDSIVVIGMLDCQEDIKKVIHYLDQFCKICKRVLKVNTTIGVGHICDSLVQLPFSYRGANEAVEARVFLEPNQAIYIKDIEPSAKEFFTFEANDVQSLMKVVKLGSTEDVQREVQEIVSYLKESVQSLNQYQVILMEIVTEALKVIRAYGVDISAVFGEKFDLYRDPAGFENLETMGQWLEDTMIRLRSFIRQERRDTAKLLMEKARQFISENYMDSDLSVDMVCSHLNVSAAYFSTLFKKEMNMTFVNYLTQIRMDQAIFLLESTDQKTYMIAEAVGYADPNYFSYVFKKKYGISPSKYRASKMENDEKNI